MPTFSKNFNPKLNFINFAGIQVKGYADSSFITIEFESDAFKEKVGAGGDVMRWRINDDRAKVEITLLPDSETNDAFSTLAILDRKKGSGVGIFSMVDMAGRSKAVGNNAWIKKMAPLQRSVDPENVKWMITVADMDLFVGGNS